ncbi:hypothetical protein D3Y57_08920 [Sphingomonas paeninsulae]|jgi:hypothetical protein|uniref:Uncharacterized protein n=1 Tax=Sphingomonas paeninsulae TaxID=2319844 RepID=A0A494TGJ5_SPHPE|nr:hypothetical protein [Sphingomonas paeninsulae]AYJ86063.1 hypothetical protein D3Y57_08920 [Sphingomonas paeninsulae]
MPIELTSAAIAWDEQATLIDLDGTAPFIGTLHDCVRHFAAFKAATQADSRVLLTKPVFRVGRKTRTWILNPDELMRLAETMATGENRSDQG